MDSRRSATGFLRLDIATRAGVAGDDLSTLAHESIWWADALRQVTSWHDPANHGDVRQDISARRAVRLVNTAQGARHIATTTEGVAGEFEARMRQMRDSAATARIITDNAVARGDLPPDTVTTMVMDSIFAPSPNRLVKFGEKVDRATRRIVDLVIITGAEHGGDVHR